MGQGTIMTFEHGPCGFGKDSIKSNEIFLVVVFEEIDSRNNIRRNP